MNRSLRAIVTLALGAVMFTACSDQSQQPEEAQRTEVAQPVSPGRLNNYTIPTCTTPAAAMSALEALTPQLFSGGANGRRGRVVQLLNEIQNLTAAGNTAVAEDSIAVLINLTIDDYDAGALRNQNSDLEGTKQRVVDFISYLYCYAGWSPLPDFDAIFSGTSEFLRNDSPTTIVVDDPNVTFAAVKVDAGQVPKKWINPETGLLEDFPGTLVTVARTTDEALDTPFDWFGLGTNTADGFRKNAYKFTTDPEITFVDPATGQPAEVLTGVCVEIPVDGSVNPLDLRLAHGVPAGFTSLPGSGNEVVGNIEILAPRPGAVLGLDCNLTEYPASTALGRFMQKVTQFVLPDQLLALGTKVTSSGGTQNFSPFAAVDRRLIATGSVSPTTAIVPLNSSSTTVNASVEVKSRRGQAAIGGLGVAFANASAGSSIESPKSTSSNGIATSPWTISDSTPTPKTATASPIGSIFTFTSVVNLSVNVIQATPLSQPSPATLPAGVQDTAYSQTFTATGGIKTYSFAFKTGSTAPTNFTLDSAGVLSSNNPVAGNYSFTVQVTSGGQTTERAYTLTINLPPVSVATTSLPRAFVGVPYSATLTAQGGAGAAGTYTWAYPTGLPAGGISGAPNGTLSGTPTAAGTINFTTTVTSTTNPPNGLSVGPSEPASLSIQVLPPTISLAFQPSPTRSQCYAIGRDFGATVPPLSVPRVRATTVVNNTVVGVQNVSVALVAVLNNGSKVAVSGNPIFTGTDGFASLAGVSINQPGTYTLSATAGSVTVSSSRFTVSPSCP